MGQILQFMSSHYLAVCISLLAVQISLLVAAIRTKKEILWVSSTVAPILSGVLTFHVPNNGQGYSIIETFLIFLIFDVVILLITVGTRAGSGGGKKLTILWKILWGAIFLGFFALIFYIIFIAYA